MFYVLFYLTPQTLVTWGMLTQWVLGFVICCTYTLILFGISVWLEKKFLNRYDSGVESESEIETKNGDTIVWINLLYALALLCMGTSGLILSLSVFNCQPVNTTPENNGWQANMKSIPAEAQSWAKNYNFKPISTTTFKYFPQTGITLFSGNDGKPEAGISGFTSSKLWQFRGSGEPVSVTNMYEPLQFTSDDSTPTTCFTASRRISAQDRINWVDVTDVRRIVCTDDGISFRTVNEKAIREPKHLFWRDDTLWAVGHPQDPDDPGEVIFSVDPHTMRASLHSQKNAKIEVESCEDEDFRRKIVLTTLCISTLPLSIFSMFLWMKKGIPTFPITAYVGISGSAVSIYFLASMDTARKFRLWPRFNNWWFSMTSGVWVFVLFILYLLRRIRRDTYVWSMSYAALTFYLGMSSLLEAPFQERDWWRWVIINIFVYLPLIFIGTISECYLVLFVGTSGLFIDAWKIADSFARVGRYKAMVPISFGVFSVSGISLGLCGWFLSKKQKQIRTYVFSLVDKYLSSFTKNNTSDETLSDEVLSDDVIPTAITIDPDFHLK